MTISNCVYLRAVHHLKLETTMRMSFLYYTGLILTIMGLIGIISETAPVWSRYFVFGLGIAILLIAYIKCPRD